VASKNLNNAKKDKFDEFYTQLSDIEKELVHYRDHFRGKVVFCNCDDPEFSNFYFYFSNCREFIFLHKNIHRPKSHINRTTASLIWSSGRSYFLYKTHSTIYSQPHRGLHL